MNRTELITVRVPMLVLSGNESLGVTGSCRALGGWKQAVIMDTDRIPYASVQIEAELPFEYKFVIADRKTGKILEWEDGFNRTASSARITDGPARIRRPLWKGAGTAIPVFSLRTMDDFGTGEFRDIEKLVDWAEMTGQKIIQLLPINDTTMTGTWEDSYPYNANSTFALHPQFIRLPEAGVPEDMEYLKLQKELNSLPEVDYERVNREKNRLLLKAFGTEWKKVSARRDFRRFMEDNREWLVPYAAFRCLRDEFGTPDFTQWGSLSAYDAAKVEAYCRKNRSAINFHCFVQYHLHRQMSSVRDYAHRKGVILKGDLPIGISRTSADAWMHPELFNMDSQAGAPPDAFSADGQNWGFPTYNWDRMAEDGFSWWKSRLRKMAEYFDAFRIDHILGFFRIWEIPVEYRSGIMGHFNPALPYSAEELRQNGFDPDTEKGIVSCTEDCTNVLFLEDPDKKGFWHPRIAAQSTAAYASLEQWRKDAYNRIYDEFFYRRHNSFWKESAYRKLPALLSATDMLACGEDLGMIPACVPETMRELQILSLEIQRMPKSMDETFADPAKYPYLSVCTTSTHDMNPLRAWWEEDRQMTERFYREVLGGTGTVPYFCEPWVCRRILEQHLNSPAMLTVLPLQDWMSIDGQLRFEKPDRERINVPAIPRYYWRYRMHITIEDLMKEDGFNVMVSGLIRNGGR